jgi:hypothetical protein
MNVLLNRQRFSRLQRALRRSAAVLSVCMAASLSFAQGAASPAPVEVPDGSPQLPAEKVVSNTSTIAVARSPGGAGSVIVEEERIQGRLANARISVGGNRGYTVVDPNAGRADRQPDNGGKRVSPSLWELFRF